MKSLIQKLVELDGPPGYESAVRQAVRTEIEPLVDQVSADNLGNLIARKGQKSNTGLRIMMSAHLDEIGVIATHVEEAGFVRFLPMGSVRASTCPGGRVRFLKGARGVIGSERLSDLSRVPAFEQMYIDVGATSRQNCPVQVGDLAVFERPFLDLGDRLVSKAMDNRINVAILIEVLRQMNVQSLRSPHELFFVFSAQEEVGERGALTAAFAIDPDLGLALDVTSCGDTPKGLRMEVKLGKGPAIKVRDQGSISDPRVVRWMVETAEAQRLPYQMEILKQGRTDAGAIQTTRRGVPAGCLSIPCRYVHTPSEMIDYNDVQNAVKLLIALLRDPINEWIDK
ncbi:MAG: M42 family metallopeptidase [Chloroflexota bacterium]